MSNLNCFFTESQKTTFETDIKKTASGDVPRQVESRAATGYYNGIRVQAGFLKFGPRFEAQIIEKERHKVS